MGTVADRRGADFRKGVARNEQACYIPYSAKNSPAENRAEDRTETREELLHRRRLIVLASAQPRGKREGDRLLEEHWRRPSHAMNRVPGTFSLCLLDSTHCVAFFLFSDRQRKSP